MAQSSPLSSTIFKESHFAKLLTVRSLVDGPSPRRTDFLPMIQEADKSSRQGEVKFLYAVFPDRPLEPAEWSELPARGRIDLEDPVRAAYENPQDRPAVYDAVARAVLEKVRELKAGGTRE